MEFTLVRSSEPGCEPGARTELRTTLETAKPAATQSPAHFGAASSNAATATAAVRTCFEWIAADGTIDQNSPVRLKRILARLQGRKLPIFINSPGGSVDDAIEMARIIRAKRLDVVVARTEYVACSPRDRACRDKKPNQMRVGQPAALARCASSCPFVLAGGVRRLVGPGAYVGVHRAVTYRILTKLMRTYRFVPKYELGIPTGTKRRLVSENPVSRSVEAVETKRETYDKIEANFVAMGVTRGVMVPMLATPNTEMRWLTNAEIGQFKLATDWLNGQQLAALQRLPPVAVPTGQAAIARPETAPISAARVGGANGRTLPASVGHSPGAEPYPSTDVSVRQRDEVVAPSPASIPPTWFGLDPSSSPPDDPVTGFVPGSGL